MPPRRLVVLDRIHSSHCASLRLCLFSCTLPGPSRRPAFLPGIQAAHLSGSASFPVPFPASDGQPSGPSRHSRCARHSSRPPAPRQAPSPQARRVDEQGTMKAGRKNLKRASHGEEGFSLQDGQSIVLVVSLRGSNIIEVMDAKGVKSLALFPAKFQKSLWIKRGSFVVVDENGRKEALDSGNKVACIVLQVLFHEQVCALQKCTKWPETFRTMLVDDSCSYEKRPEARCSPKTMSDSDGEDGLPPLEANLNRSRPFELYPGSDSDSDDTNADHGGSPA